MIEQIAQLLRYQLSDPRLSSSLDTIMAMLTHVFMRVLLSSTILGVANHLAIFIRGEWHMQAPTLVKLYVCVCIASAAFQTRYDITLRQAAVNTASLSFFYALGLFSSIIIYRRYFYRLRHFPGPWAASVTKFWHVWKCRNGKNFLVIEKLRKEYGPVIRTGPEELTIIDASVPNAVDGPKNNCTKAVWYDFLLPEIALNTTRSKKDHDSRRRIWDNCFSTKALAIYEERIFDYAEILIQRIEQLAQQSKPVNGSDWSYWFTFDVMGEFAFARSFGMLQNENWHFAVRLLRRAMSLLGPFSPVPWLAQIAFYITPWMYIVRDWLSMMERYKKRMGERIEVSIMLSHICTLLNNA